MSTVKLTYREAVRAALRHALATDERVFLMGEDVGGYGGAFAVSLGLLDEFGPERVRNAPLSESAFVGAGIGAALGGMRPIVEVMTINFSLLALDQVVNNAATLRYMSGGQMSVPLVVRMATGGGRQMAAQHEHSLEAWYAHIPGIKALAPATVEDARGMLLAALQEPDPVFIFEHALLYPLEGEIDEEPRAVDIAHAAVRREGADVTVVTYGGSLGKCLAAAEHARAGARPRGRGDRPPHVAPARHRHHPHLAREDASRGDRRRGLEDGRALRRAQRPDHGAGLRPARLAGAAGVRRRGADALRQAPRGGGAPERRARRRGGAGDGVLMADFVMPSLGADMSAGTLAAWLKQPGDAVKRGDIIAVVHTDKADVEVEVFTTGVIEQMLIEPGTEVPVGTPLAVIREEGAAPAPAPAAVVPAAAAPPAAAPAPPPAAPSAPTPHVPAEHRLLISPSARQLAHELGIEVDALEGSGPGGRIQRRDVEAAAAAREAAPSEAAPPAAAPAPAPRQWRPLRRLLRLRRRRRLRCRRPPSAAPPCVARSRPR